MLIAANQAIDHLVQVEPKTKLGLVNFGIGVEVIGDGS
jgi:hypothetical protein